MPSFTVVRVVAGDDGQSRFEDAAPPLDEVRPGLGVGGVEAAAGVGFRRFAPGFASDFHPTALRELAVVLSGSAEYEVASGERRTLHPGDAIRLEDTHGVGHRSRNRGEGERVMLVVALPG
ncbi:MAG: cupin domain-containing protein [Myxococcota bacterium]